MASLMTAFRPSLAAAVLAALLTYLPAAGPSHAAPPEDRGSGLTPVGQLYSLRSGVKVRPVSTDDPHISSPKSVNFHPDGHKVYINALEGLETLVYSVPDLTLLKAVSHSFGPADADLFNGETTLFDYPYHHAREPELLNVFSGKPVEGTFSHGGRYFWVPYYRRDFDKNASDPSAMAVIDTRTDAIVRVVPTGPLPKMVAASPDGKYLAVTHWGDNTVGLMDISSEDPRDFAYVRHMVDGARLNTRNITGNRDNNCGRCLRGTVFSPDSSRLLVGRMAGTGIAVFSIPEGRLLGAFTSFSPSPRHLVADPGRDLLYASDSKQGMVSRTSLSEALKSVEEAGGRDVRGPAGQRIDVGTRPRTVAVTPDGRTLFTSVHGSFKLVRVDTDSWRVTGTEDVSPAPVGLGLSPDGRYVAVTSQGYRDKSAPGGYSGGNSVEFFSLD
ncbi:MAG: YncE family protein [Deltaproteobacteria bacterium]|jgi:DNA-binding beta-propeller fold protein YncE|nr:YncE family protein [Deltaproteobacteria bacterium]